MKAIGSTLTLLLLTAMFCCGPAAAGATLASSFKKAVSMNDLKKISYDYVSIAGNNIIVKGNVHIPLGDFDIYADKAIINTESRDLDVTGNIRIYRKVVTRSAVSPEELARLEEASGVSTRVTGIATDVFGAQKINVEITYIDGTITAQTFAGNLNTGFFSFTHAQLTFNTIVCRAESGIRKPNGAIQLKGAEITSCNYLESLNAHYSISCGDAELTPYNTDTFGLGNAVTNRGEYSILASNCTVNIYGVPVFWLPLFYKPKDENLGLFQIQAGKNDDWGFYISLSKKFQILDYPNTTARIRADWFERRGFGYGASIRSSSEDSKTTIFAYSIYDKHPYASTDTRKYDIKIPHNRYDLRISNLTHITPTFDFRGNLELLSDPYFNRDFFSGYYNSDPRPVTFAALEKQFEHFAASLYVRPQANDFFNAVEQLPSGRIDIQRQELFDTNLYYQGEASVAYLQRRWADWKDNRIRMEQPDNYRSGRFDNLHFFYYPLRLDWLNIVPRAGFRMTGYTASSKHKVSDRDLAVMLQSDTPNAPAYRYSNYDDDGGGRFRFAAEFGVELNTKIYSTWQDVRSPLLQLDGLRHVMTPYINYTYIPRPTVDRRNLYYFDDIDQINEQNFIRFGVLNRLQTRDGQQLRNYLTLENYWDYHIQPQKEFNHVGDFCTKLTVTPIKGVTLSTFFSIAAGGDNDVFTDKDREVIRRGRNVGHPGLDLKWLNRWDLSLTYEPVADFIFRFSYNYQNPYATQSAYSMGSTLSDIESGSAFNRYFMNSIQQLNFGMSFPITPDRRTIGKYDIFYDFNAGMVTSQRFSVIRKFHCIEVAAELNLETDYDSHDRKSHDTSFYLTAYLTGLTGPLQQAQQSMLTRARDRESQNGGFF